jgi:hypothetical protein
MMKKRAEKLLHEINTKKMINERARRKAPTRNKHRKEDEQMKKEARIKNRH